MTVEQLFYNGDIITMENFDDAPEAVLVRDGNIIAVGMLEELKALATAECQAISLQGKTLMPAFIVEPCPPFSLSISLTISG